MQRSSESIGSLAAALAKAQGELTNPEKSLVGTIPANGPGGAERMFRYASLSSGPLGSRTSTMVRLTAPIDTKPPCGARSAKSCSRSTSCGGLDSRTALFISPSRPAAGQ